MGGGPRIRECASVHAYIRTGTWALVRGPRTYTRIIKKKG